MINKVHMSIAEEFNTPPHLKEEFQYHYDEAEYHLEQYLRSMEEMENHYRKFREHSRYRDQFSRQLKEMRDVS